MAVSKHLHSDDTTWKLLPLCVFRPGENSEQPRRPPTASQKKDNCDDNGEPLCREKLLH